MHIKKRIKLALIVLTRKQIVLISRTHCNDFEIDYFGIDCKGLSQITNEVSIAAHEVFILGEAQNSAIDEANLIIKNCEEK